MNRLGVFLLGTALVTGGSALASAQPVEHHDRGYVDRDGGRARDRDNRDNRRYADRDDRGRSYVNGDNSGRNRDRDDTRFRDRDDRGVYNRNSSRWDGHRWMRWDGHRWVY